MEKTAIEISNKSPVVDTGALYPGQTHLQG